MLFILKHVFYKVYEITSFSYKLSKTKNKIPISEPYHIAQCVEQISSEPYSKRKFKIKWLENVKSHDKGTLYICSSDDRISVDSIICEVRMHKLTRFNFLLTIEEEEKIYISNTNCSEDASSVYNRSPISSQQIDDDTVNQNANSLQTNNRTTAMHENSRTVSKFVNFNLLDYSFTTRIGRNLHCEKFDIVWGVANLGLNCFSETASLHDAPLINFTEENKNILFVHIENFTNKENFKENVVDETENEILATQHNESIFYTCSDICLPTHINQMISSEEENYVIIVPNIEGSNDMQNSDENNLKSLSPLYMSSDSEYVPESESSEDSEGELPEEKVNQKMSSVTINKCVQRNVANVSELSGVYGDEISKNLNETNEITVQCSVKNEMGRRVYDKRHACYFCGKLICKVTRHMECIHNKEIEVAKLLAMDPISTQRKEGFLCILRAGDYYHNCEVIGMKSGELLLTRRPAENDRINVSFKDYGPCPNCLGFFLLNNLWHHTKYTCPKKPLISVNEDQPSSEIKAITRRDIRGESIALLGPSNISPDFRKYILGTLKTDDVSAICVEDELILKFGVLLFEKYSSYQHDYIRQCLRQLARLLLEVCKINKEIKTFSDVLLPENFDTVIRGVKTLCAFKCNDLQYTQYDIPSLALKIGHNLRKCALISRGLAIRKGDLHTDRKMEGFLNLMNIEWNSRVSSAALRTLKEKKMNSSLLLPLTDDILKLNKYLNSVINELVGKFNTFSQKDWSRLASATLCRIILFNKRRSGEASRITLQHYTCRPNWADQCTSELKESLTPLEQTLANRLTIIEVPGKSRKNFKVPVLLSQEMKIAVDKLIETRSTVSIDNKNQYIFARSFQSLGHLRGHDCLRQFCKESNLQKPQLITSTKLRKYVATVVQVFDLKENEYDWLARHLGHDIRIHREFYRLHESAVELTKVSRILLAVDAGETNKFAGKSLDEINVEELPDVEQIENNESDSDDCTETINSQFEKEFVETEKNVSKDREATMSGKTTNLAKKKNIRTPWTFDIRKEIVPNKARAEECISCNSETLKNRSWKDVKYCVYNQIQVTKRKKK